MKSIRWSLLVLSLVSTLGLAVPPARAVDADAAQAMVKKNDCGKCHAADRDKKAPSWKKIAGKHKGKPDAAEKLAKHLTTSPTVKMEDGTEEEHKAVKSKDPADIQNLVAWILAR